MKKLLLSLLAFPLIAHASWFDFEAGYGLQKSQDMGDGTWYQEGGPYHRKLDGKAYLAGITGTVYESGPWSVNYHLDYLYYGGLGTGCTCVGDDFYDGATHSRKPGYSSTAVFNSQGHVQGVPLTLDLGYTWYGVRFSVEGGAWVYWPTWHTSVALPDGSSLDLSHKPTAQLGYVVGARIESGHTSLSYRYYRMKDKWNPNPGIVTSTQMLMLNWRF